MLLLQLNAGDKDCAARIRRRAAIAPGPGVVALVMDHHTLAALIDDVRLRTAGAAMPTAIMTSASWAYMLREVIGRFHLYEDQGQAPGV